MKLHKLIFTAIAGSLLFVSCSDDDSQDNRPSGAYDNGVLVLNEGNFGAGNSTVSFLGSSRVIENDIFSSVNSGELLGDTGMDIEFSDDLAYIVLNGSNEIKIVNRYTFVKVGGITSGLVNPRYIEIENNKAYITCWGDGSVATDDYVAVISLATNTVTNTIPVVEGPERIVEENGKLYVAHAGGYNFNNKISVINTLDDTLATTITVGAVPNSLEIENGNLYVMSGGFPFYAETETAGQLDVISLSTNTVTRTLSFSGIAHPSNLVIEDNKIYYTEDNGIYVMALNDTSLPASPLFTTTEQGSYGIYSFEVEDDTIYIGDAVDYSSNGKIYLYSLQGSRINDFNVGVTPRGFYFND